MVDILALISSILFTPAFSISFFYETGVIQFYGNCVRKNKSTVTADILEQKSVPKPERKIRPERKSGTKSIVIPVKVKIALPVLRHRSSGASMRNLRFVPKSNMSLRF